MGFYSDRVLPHIVNKVCGLQSAAPLRQRVCSQAHGDVLEIGFGSGLNLPHYPSAVQRVEAVEPSDVAWRLSEKNRRQAAFTVARSAYDAQRLPFDDASFDMAISTWTMCTIPDIDAALREVRRVLKPGATLSFVEHGLAPDQKVQRWQRRLEPIQKRMVGGCHLTRQFSVLVAAAGFTIDEVDTFYEDGAPKFLAADTLGTAFASL